jgi:hypothetical protein
MFLSEFSAAGGLEDPEAERLINTRGAMSEEEIEWAELCKRGGAT